MGSRFGNYDPELLADDGGAVKSDRNLGRLWLVLSGPHLDILLKDNLVNFRKNNSSI